MDISHSPNLKEFPDLSSAKNLETLNLSSCFSLVEIPSSFRNLEKLHRLEMNFCTKLQVVPSLFGLASLDTVRIVGCCQLRKLPDISGNITELRISDTVLQGLGESVRHLSRLEVLSIYGSAVRHSLLERPHMAETLLERSGAEDIERIPDCIKDLQRLEAIFIAGCPKLSSLPQLPRSLTRLSVDKCESLETLAPFDTSIWRLCFVDCFKLCREARSVITQKSSWGCLPGSKVPEEFHHRALGSCLSIRSDVYRFRICVVLSPKHEMVDNYAKRLECRMRINGCPVEVKVYPVYVIQSEHLFILASKLRQLEHNSEISFEVTTTSQEIDILECGVQVLDGKKPTEALAARETMNRDQNPE